LPITTILAWEGFQKIQPRQHGSAFQPQAIDVRNLITSPKPGHPNQLIYTNGTTPMLDLTGKSTQKTASKASIIPSF
jgi:hypothetical protein